MSFTRQPARIVYEQTEHGAVVEIRGTNEEIVTGLVRLAASASERTGFSLVSFAAMLPTLAALDEERLSGREMIDLNAIRKAKEGGK